MDFYPSAEPATLSSLDRKLDEILAVVQAMQRRVTAIEVPDETVGLAAAVRLSGLTANKLRSLIAVGVFSDARPPDCRSSGTPVRWFASELRAYQRGGKEAVRLVRTTRGRD